VPREKAMEWFDPSPYIADSHKITDIFGYWPTFHDAWIHELKMSVADGEPWVPGSVAPTLDLIIHVFEMTKEVDAEGCLVLRKHTLVHFQFRNVEDLELRKFSFQNSILELIFGHKPMAHRPIECPPLDVLTVRVSSSCGLSGEFTCHSGVVLSAEPCDGYGRLLARSS
jgi:hypothetical protein